MRILHILFALAISWSAHAQYRVDLSLVPQEIRQSLNSTLKNMSLNNMNTEEIDDLVKLIYLNSQYDPVRAVQISDHVVQIQISKRMRIQKVTFTGLKDMTVSEAHRIVTALEGDAFDPDLLVKQGENLQDAYKAMGYLNAEVDIEFPTTPDCQVNLNVVVRTGVPARIQKIDVNIDNDYLKSALLQSLKHFKNDILTQDRIKEVQADVESFLKSKKAYQASFESPTIELSTDQRFAFLNFKIKNAEPYEFKIEGSTQISSLLSLDDTLDLVNTPATGANFIPELTNRLRDYYHNRGYARVEITSSEKESLADHIRKVTFHVKEGPVVKIDKFIIQGQYSHKTEFYENLILENATGVLKRRLYVKDELDQAVDLMVKELQNEGYLLAQVISTRAIYNSNKDTVNILVNINEGLQTTVKSIEFENIKAFTPEVLDKVVNLKPGEPLQLSKIDQALRNLKKFYKDHGYLEMMILNEKQDLVHYNQDNSLATLQFKIFEGPQVRVQSIVIEGLRQTKEYVVRFELDFKEGDILTPTRIDESISQLQRSGYFSAVDIRTLEDKTEVSNRTVLIRVTEAEPGFVQAGVGITNEREFTVRGFLGGGYRNLGGTGRGFSVRADGSYNVTDIHYFENRLTAGYLEPFLFDSKYKGRVNVTRSNTITDFDNKRATLTILQTWSIEKDFTSHVTGVWDVYSRASSEDFNIHSPLDKVDLEIASTDVTLDLDYRDNLFRPRHGNLSRFNMEYGAPWLGSTRTISYVRGTASYTHYLSFGKDRFTWSNGVRYGYLENINNRLDGGVPYDKKGFYLGGPSTIRGFDPTRESFPDIELIPNDKMTKQTEMYLIKSTFSYPIYGIVDGTLFYDGGRVQVGGIDIGFGYRSSAGVGLLINTPVGPLNLEVGWKIGRLYKTAYRDESPYAFHLSFGSF